MTNSTQSNGNNFFKLACLASIAAGITLAVIALASAAPVGFAISAGLSVTVSGLLLSAVIRLCCGCVGSGWGSGPIVVGNTAAPIVVVDNSPSYWNRFSNWLSGPSWFSGWGNSVNVSNPGRYHGHQATVPAFSSNVHGNGSLRPSSFSTSTSAHHGQRTTHAPYVQPGSSGGGMFGGLGGHHHTAVPSYSGGAASHHASSSASFGGGGHSHAHHR